MILRNAEGYPLLETHDYEEMVTAIDGHRENGEKVSWDDNETLDEKAIRDGAAAQAKAREEAKILDKQREDEEREAWEAKRRLEAEQD